MSTRESTASTAARGRAAVADELRRRGWKVRDELVSGRHRLVIEKYSRRTRVRVSSKTRGTWQTSTREGAAVAEPEHHGRWWVFVDLAPTQSEFFVVPEAWMVEDIHARHQDYLARHGGTRAVSADSTHHSVHRSRIERWRDGWHSMDELASDPVVGPAL